MVLVYVWVDSEFERITAWQSDYDKSYTLQLKKIMVPL
jgi:hypothetical protein